MPKPAQIVLVSGLTGSGKTTILGDIMRTLPGKKSIIRIDEWGRLSVHPMGIKLLDDSDSTELYGGRGLSASLIPMILKDLNSLIGIGTEYIFVETSGLIKPATLDPLIRAAEETNSEALRYLGMICLIDATDFPDQPSNNIHLYEKAAYADCFIISKADSVPKRTLAAINTELKRFRPCAAILVRSRKGLSGSAILDGLDTSTCSVSAAVPRGVKNHNVPQLCTLLPEAPVRRGDLETFLHAITPRAFRINGFLHVQGSQPWVNIDMVEDSISLESVPEHAARSMCLGLTFMWKNPSVTDTELVRDWVSATGVKGSVVM
ncbi:GTP-binding protein [Breznakiella homolactica]|uniref:CobW/HypB/UreG nucleotide-binding domain-containing protein n=1 Tax=Breznakiella homolactica TaxID=2798577 RepID=A0A7T7XQF6_9SPIR|nr:GTP-binding protein [Breznakiella homolactica]QQO10498.1 hypothetical protein JFL75_06180 [Breznakiella homolactica]